jgi:hypothetical protein
LRSKEDRLEDKSGSTAICTEREEKVMIDEIVTAICPNTVREKEGERERERERRRAGDQDKRRKTTTKG